MKYGKFPWGQPIERYEVGPYSILKYHPRKTTGSIVLNEPDPDKVSYHGWIDGEDVHESWPTLETCLAGLIGRKYAGNNNGGVGYYFCKMVSAPPYDTEGKS